MPLPTSRSREFAKELNFKAMHHSYERVTQLFLAYLVLHVCIQYIWPKIMRYKRFDLHKCFPLLMNVANTLNNFEPLVIYAQSRMGSLMHKVDVSLALSTNHGNLFSQRNTGT